MSSTDSDTPTDGVFTVAGSNLIRSNGVYRASVYSYGYRREEKIEVRLINEDEDVVDKRVVTLKGNQIQVVDLEAGNISHGDFNLKVVNKTGEYFEETRCLHVNDKKFAVFIQTDKSVYKPSDNVKFRIFVVDGETKPFKFDNIEIFITDGADNRIKQFENPSSSFKKGVYQDELQLSDSPVMGVWKINVKVNNTDGAVKTFDVEEYVLPKFEVTIDVPSNISFKDEIIRAKVNAKYTFGKIAKGNATVTAEVENSHHHYRFGSSESTKKVSKTVAVDGNNFVEFDFRKELEIRNQSYVQTVKLTASFTDELSGKEATATAHVKIHKESLKMELKQSANRFKPGLSFNITALISSHDKSIPITDKINPVKFVVTYYWDILRKVKTVHEESISGRRMYPGDDYESWEENCSDKEYKIFPENGVAKLEIDVEKGTKQFSVSAKYLNIQENIHRIQKVESLCKQYIQAKLLTEKPNLNENVKLEVSSTASIDQLNYLIHSSGKLLISEHENFASNTKHVIDFKPSISMLPKSTIVIYYIAQNGEIISDKIEIEFGNQLMNHINLKLSTEQAKPGENLNISVDTRPESFVGLLGVDQSVLLMKKGNDIESDTVFGELKKFGEIKRYNNSYYGGNDVKDFQDLVLITNAKMVSEMRHMEYACYSRSSISPHAFGAVRSMKSVAPPMAMNFMADAMPEIGMDGGAPPPKPIEVRTKFPETWLYDNLDFGSETTKILTKKVPDTITSWIITGFSLDPVTGLGLTQQPSKLNVFQPFFVSTNLPYSIKRGEVVSIPIIVFNYLDSDQQTHVTLFNEFNEFEFINPDDDEDSSAKRQKRGTETARKTEVLLKSEEGATVSFMIRPLKAGQITIKVIAESAMAGDGVEKQLKVEPEGVPQYLNEAVLIDLRNEQEFKRIIDIMIPQEAVPDSTRIEVSAIGDILGPSIENLDKLIKLPYGCGEQNMLNFVPNIVVLDYLTNLNKLNPQIEAKAKKFMETGYQRELTYKHNDGSYSAFGKYDNHGSTWLTAFVAKSFHQASKHIRIDQNIILEALKFLKNTQDKDGSFPEHGHVCHRDMQGGSSKGIALTAYTLITFLENKPMATKFEEVIKKALDYVVDNLNSLDDIYSLAIANYALQLAGHEKKDMLLEKLNQMSINKDGMKHWEKDIPKSDKNEDQWFYRPNSVNVEMSAYAMQALMQADRDTDAIPVMKWLVTQRNENGGFQSTQDTVVGLQALSKLAAKVHVADSDLNITVIPENSNPTNINVNTENSLVLQKHELSPDARHFQVSATGKGFSILQISYKYNLDNSGKFPRFKLNPVVDDASNKGFLLLNIGATFIADELLQQSNMAVMEVTLPSGFTFDNDHMSELLATEKVKKVETKDGDTVIMIYFDDIGTKEIVAQIKAYRSHAVAKQKPAPIVIYDYYDNSRCARTFYNPPEILISDIAAA